MNEGDLKMVLGAYIYLAPGFDPETHRLTQQLGAFKIHFIGIDPERIEEVPKLGQRLLEEGAQFIELCGGFGPTWISKVREATTHKIPVGGVFYGPEDRKPLLELRERMRDKRGSG